MIPMNIYARCRHAIGWHLVETVLYYALFLGHHTILFATAPSSLYGMIASSFSVLYFGVDFICGGFESTLAPFLAHASSNKREFLRLIKYLFITNVILLTLSALLVGIGSWFYALSWLSLSLICPLIVLEGVKRMARNLLHMGFHNRYATTLELLTIISYVGLFWSWYSITGTITLYTALVPMIITSGITTILLGMRIYRWYEAIELTPTDKLSYTDLTQQRLWAWFNSLHHLLVSGNVLIPLCAWHFGFAFAGMLKLSYHAAYAITSLIRKISRNPSHALLAHTKTASLAHKQKAFRWITRYLTHLLYFVGIFTLINGAKIVSWHTQSSETLIISGLYLFIGLIALESLVTAYESFYFTQQQSHWVILSNTIASLATITLFFWNPSSPLWFLGALLAARLTVFGVLALISSYYWQLYPSWRIRSDYAVLTTIISLLIYFYC